MVDQEFGVVAKDSYRLRRFVEMLQWTETWVEAKSDGEESHYTYTKEWSAEPIDSRKFEDKQY